MSNEIPEVSRVNLYNILANWNYIFIFYMMIHWVYKETKNCIIGRIKTDKTSVPYYITRLQKHQTNQC